MNTIIKLCTCALTNVVPEYDDIVKGNDNIVYSKKALLKWLLDNNISPVTKEPMTTNDIIECPIIRNICIELHKFNLGIYNINVILNKSSIMDVSYIKSKIRRTIINNIINHGHSIFGSSSYKMLVNKDNMSNYYLYCETAIQGLPFHNYNNKLFHPSSYNSRQDLKTINDIDVFSKKGNIDNIISDILSLTELQQYTYKIYTSYNKQYKNSCFNKRNNIKTLYIKMSIATLGYIEIKIDIIVPKLIVGYEDVEIYLGPHPNIIKRIFYNKLGYNYEDCEIENISDILNWCIINYNIKKTLTNILSHECLSFGNKIEDINEIIRDIINYIKKLVFELSTFIIDNLSITIHDIYLKYQVWNNENVRINNNFNEIDYIDLIKHIDNIKTNINFNIISEIDNLSHGKILIIDNQYINICCDPDFNIIQYNSSLNIIKKNQYIDI